MSTAHLVTASLIWLAIASPFTANTAAAQSRSDKKSSLKACIDHYVPEGRSSSNRDVDWMLSRCASEYSTFIDSVPVEIRDKYVSLVRQYISHELAKA